MEIPEKIDRRRVTSIGDKAFCQNETLSRISIPLSVTRIGDLAYQSCRYLQEIFLPGNIKSIGLGAFYGCLGLMEIRVDRDNQDYSSLDGVLFNKDQTTLIHCPWGKTGIYIVPKTVTKIEANGFFGTALRQINISENVSSITPTIPHWKRGSGRSLKKIKVHSQNRFFSSVDGVLFNKDQTQLLVCPAAREGTYVIPNGVTDIGRKTFYNCTGLTNIKIPQGVSRIGQGAFRDCRSLSNLYIPDSVTQIDRYTFWGCENLQTLLFYGDAPSIGGDVFSESSNVVVYYPKDKNGWKDTFGGRPTKPH